MKLLFLLFTFIISTAFFSQRTHESNYDQCHPSISVISEYIAYLDSAFIHKNKPSEVVITERSFVNGKLVYDKPVLIQRYDPSGKRIFSQLNTWTETRRSSNSTYYYPDSIIMINQGYKFADSIRSNRVTVYKSYLINDTLSRTIEYEYAHDSLLRMKDNGIFDSRAALREWREKRGSGPAASIPKSKIPVEHNLPGDEFPTDPDPVVEKDSLGRTVKVRIFELMYVNGKAYGIPSCISLINYAGSSLHRKSLNVYRQDRNEYSEMVKKAGDKETVFKWPECYSPSCLGYNFEASDFQSGIPMAMKIAYGTSDQNYKLYAATISTW